MNKKPAFPIDSDHIESGYNQEFGGLTKREPIAAMCLQGLCVTAIPGPHNMDLTPENYDKARHAIRIADALLDELSKEQ